MKVFGSNYLINKTNRYFVGLWNVTQKKIMGALGVLRTEKVGNLSEGISAQGPSHWAQVDETVSDRGSGLVGVPPGTARHSPEDGL